MSSTEITEYFDATEDREVREDLVFAVNNVHDPKIAIDCGCGAGVLHTLLFQIRTVCLATIICFWETRRGRGGARRESHAVVVQVLLTFCF